MRAVDGGDGAVEAGVGPRKPAIEITVHPAAEGGSVLRELLAGLEEQGVPWEVEVAGGEAVALAHRAAGRSVLRVGLAVAGDGTVVLHHAQLPPERPVQHLPRAGPTQARLAGQNAGRLVKGLPLEGLSQPPAGSGSSAPDRRVDPAAVAGVVWQVLRRLGILPR